MPTSCRRRRCSGRCRGSTTWKARSPCSKPSLTKGRSTRYSSSLRWKKAQTCRERSRTEPASRTCLGLLIASLLCASASRCGPVALAGARHSQRQQATLRQCYPKHNRKEARRNDPAPSVPDANRMPNGRIYGPDDGLGFSDQAGPARSAPTMAHLLLIDDDPALMPGQVRQAFPAPAHWVEVAATGAEGLERVGAGPPDVIPLDLGLPDP